MVGSIISPGDVRRLRRLFDDWGLEYILLPDISQTMQAPLTGQPPRIPAGGTPLTDIRDTANSKSTLTIGGLVQEPGAGDHLQQEFGISHTALPLPMGLEFTDLLAASLEERSGLPMPESYELERGLLLDTMADAHKNLAGVKAAVYGDTEMVLGLIKIMAELGMKPQIVATGAANQEFFNLASGMAPEAKVLIGADFSQIAAEVAGKDIDLLVGPFTGRQLSRRESIPLFRIGLPNHDRFGASRQIVLGYDGAMNLVEGMANALLEHGERA